jgi:hypothetical protein
VTGSRKSIISINNCLRRLSPSGLQASRPSSQCKDPGPEGPALVHPGGVMKVATFTSSVQVSGVRCQQLKSTAGSESLMKWTFFHRC